MQGKTLELIIPMIKGTNNVMINVRILGEIKGRTIDKVPGTIEGESLEKGFHQSLGVTLQQSIGTRMHIQERL
jgi:hypothetical protein